MGAQNKLLGMGASVLALANVVGKLYSQQNKKGIAKAKQGYEKAVNTKKENKELVKQNIDKVEAKTVVNSGFGQLAHDTEAVEEQPIKQKYVLSEEGATFPITAETSQTNIPVDEEVETLLEVKQKNLNRAVAGERNASKQKELWALYAKKHHLYEYDRAATKNFLDEFGFNKSAADYKAVGLDKHELNSFAITEAEEQGESWPSLISTSFASMKKKFSGNDLAQEYLDLQETVLQNRHGSFSGEDATDWNKDMDWSQLVMDFDQVVDDMKSGKYKEFMKKYNGYDEDAKSENLYEQKGKEKMLEVEKTKQEPEIKNKELDWEHFGWSGSLERSTKEEQKETYQVWSENESIPNRNFDDFKF